MAAVAPRKPVLDGLKYALAVMVIGLHTFFLADRAPAASYLLVNGLFRIAVPLFVLISGYYLYEPLQQGRARRWLARITLLYAVWMLVYLPVWARPAGLAWPRQGLAWGWTLAFGFFHLWYLPGIVYATLLLARLRRLPAGGLLALALVLYATGCVLQYGARYRGWAIPEPVPGLGDAWAYRNFALFVLPFLAIGYLLRQARVVERLPHPLASVLALAGLLALLAEAGFNLHHVPVPSAGFDMPATLLLACPALFVFCAGFDGHRDTRTLALQASALYLVHPWLQLLIEKFAGLQASALTLAVLAAAIPAAAVLERLARRWRWLL